MYLLLSVYDVLIACKSLQLIGETKGKLLKQFEIEDMGEVRQYLELDIKQNTENEEIVISEEKYLGK